MGSERLNPTENSTRARIAAVWERGLPETRERLAMLERTAETLREGNADLTEAAGVAHKMAGSLGMFGFAEGTRVARELELELESETPRAEQVTRLVAELRGAILPGG